MGSDSASASIASTTRREFPSASARSRAVERNPELRETFTFIFVATPSRSDLPAYRALEEEMMQSVIAINEQFGTPTWTPIVLINENVTRICSRACIARRTCASSPRCRTE